MLTIITGHNLELNVFYYKFEAQWYPLYHKHPNIQADYGYKMVAMAQERNEHPIIITQSNYIFVGARLASKELQCEFKVIYYNSEDTEYTNEYVENSFHTLPKLANGYMEFHFKNGNMVEKNWPKDCFQLMKI